MLRIRSLALLVVVALGAFYLGGLMEFQYGGFAPNWVKAILLSHPPQHDLDLNAIEEVFTTIQDHYVKPDPNAARLTEGAQSGIVGALDDRFSRYLTPEEYQQDQNFLAGSFAGIGASVTQRGTQVVVDSVLANTPAQRDGVKAGDVIVSIDGHDAQGLTADEVVKRIRGKAGTPVVLGLQRGGQSLTITLTREEITVPSVASHVFDNRVLYVRIFDFGDRTAAEFDQALKEHLKGPVNEVVLDLRDNPGGFVDAATDVISEFVRSGASTILVRRGGSREVKTVSGTGRAFAPPLVVLVNENTASASEITAGALRDHGRATLLGAKTFGKGSVQEDFRLRNYGDLHLTIAYWLTPNGHSINQVGITPDVAVPLAKSDDEYAVDRAPNDFSRDSQLLAALHRLEG